jgi:hypothetical protein
MIKPMNKKLESEPKKSDNIHAKQSVTKPAKPEEYGGPKGLEPTRYGDWERKGRCVDF